MIAAQELAHWRCGMRRTGLVLTVLAGALVVALVAGAGPAASGLGEDVRWFSGDANCDGRIDSIDALVVLQFDAGLLDKLVFP